MRNLIIAGFADNTLVAGIASYFTSGAFMERVSGRIAVILF